MVFLYIYRIGIQRKKFKYQTSSYRGGHEYLKNLNKIENQSCLKVPDVGIQYDRIRATITMQQTEKRSESVGPRKHPKTVQICTTDHYDQILEGLVFWKYIQ